MLAPTRVRFDDSSKSKDLSCRNPGRRDDKKVFTLESAVRGFRRMAESVSPWRRDKKTSERCHHPEI